jgi:hypothetical protein
MPTKFYHALNCHRRIAAGGLLFTFEAYGQIGGSWCGVLATENAAEQAALDGLVKDPASAVSELTEGEYSSKKGVAIRRERDLRSLNPLPLPAAPSLTPAQARIANKAAVLVEKASEHPVEPPAPKPEREAVESVADALSLGTVQLPPKA